MQTNNSFIKIIRKQQSKANCTDWLEVNYSENESK